MVRLPRRKTVDPAASGAFSDLAFILIIFFVLVAVFNAETALTLLLPDSEEPENTAVEDILEFRVSPGGEYRYGEERIGLVEAAELIEARRRQTPNITLLATIDPEAPYGAVVGLVDLARRLEVENFSFRTGALQ